MKQTKSQKLLKAFSVIEFLTGIMFLLLLVLMLLALRNETVYQQYLEDRMEIIMSVIKLIINVVILFISSYILDRVSKDASRHNSALTVTLIVIAYEIFNFITSLGKGVPANLGAMVFTVLMNMFVLYLISRVRQEYQKTEE